MRLLILRVQHKGIRSSKSKNNASAIGAVTHVCSQMASFEQELKGAECLSYDTRYTSYSTSFLPRSRPKSHQNENKSNMQKNKDIE